MGCLFTARTFPQQLMTFFGKVSNFCSSNCLCKTKLGKENKSMKASYPNSNNRYGLPFVLALRGIYKQISKMFPLGPLMTIYTSFICLSLLITPSVHADSSGGLYNFSKLLSESNPFAKKKPLTVGGKFLL